MAIQFLPQTNAVQDIYAAQTPLAVPAGCEEETNNNEEPQEPSPEL